MCDAPQGCVVLTLPPWAVFWELEESAEAAQYLSCCVRVKTRFSKGMGRNSKGLGGHFVLFTMNLAFPGCTETAGLSFTRFVWQQLSPCWSVCCVSGLECPVPALTLPSLPPKKYDPSDPAYAYAQLTHDELIQLVLKQKDTITRKDLQVRELEDYIDNLLVRVMEETPNILRVSMSGNRKAGKM